MGVLTVTAKGQVTLRKELLQHLGVTPGDKITVDLLPGGEVALKAAAKTKKISDFIGCLEGGSISLSLEEIEQAISDGWSGKL